MAARGTRLKNAAADLLPQICLQISSLAAWEASKQGVIHVQRALMGNICLADVVFKISAGRGKG